MQQAQLLQTVVCSRPGCCWQHVAVGNSIQKYHMCNPCDMCFRTVGSKPIHDNFHRSELVSKSVRLCVGPQTSPDCPRGPLDRCQNVRVRGLGCPSGLSRAWALGLVGGWCRDVHFRRFRFRRCRFRRSYPQVGRRRPPSKS